METLRKLKTRLLRPVQRQDYDSVIHALPSLLGEAWNPSTSDAEGLADWTELVRDDKHVSLFARFAKDEFARYVRSEVGRLVAAAQALRSHVAMDPSLLDLTGPGENPRAVVELDALLTATEQEWAAMHGDEQDAPRPFGAAQTLFDLLWLLGPGYVDYRKLDRRQVLFPVISDGGAEVAVATFTRLAVEAPLSALMGDKDLPLQHGAYVLARPGLLDAPDAVPGVPSMPISFALDLEFRQALSDAWHLEADQRSRARREGTLTVVSFALLRRNVQPTDAFGGGSGGAAFACALRSLWRNGPAVDRRFAVTAQLRDPDHETREPTGDLFAVEGEREKLEACQTEKKELIIAQIPREPEARQGLVDPRTARNLDEAYAIAVGQEDLMRLLQYVQQHYQQLPAYYPARLRERSPAQTPPLGDEAASSFQVWTNVRLTPDRWRVPEHYTEDAIKGRSQEDLYSPLQMNEPDQKEEPEGASKRRVLAPPVRWNSPERRRKYQSGVLIGDPGVGKSWLLRYEAAHLISNTLTTLRDPDREAELHVPILVRFSEVLRLLRPGVKNQALPLSALIEALLSDSDACEHLGIAGRTTKDCLEDEALLRKLRIPHALLGALAGFVNAMARVAQNEGGEASLGWNDLVPERLLLDLAVSLLVAHGSIDGMAAPFQITVLIDAVDEVHASQRKNVTLWGWLAQADTPTGLSAWATMRAKEYTQAWFDPWKPEGGDGASPAPRRSLLEILPLDTPQIQDFITKWFDGHPHGDVFKRDLSGLLLGPDAIQLRGMAEIPILLSFLATLYETGVRDDANEAWNANETQVPLRPEEARERFERLKRAQLYEEITKRLFTQRHEDRGLHNLNRPHEHEGRSENEIRRAGPFDLATDDDVLGYNDALLDTCAYAAFMLFASADGDGAFSAKDLKKQLLFNKYLGRALKRVGLVDDETSIRTKDKCVDVAFDDLGHSTLFVQVSGNSEEIENDALGTRRFMFLHRTIHEYLVARYLAKEIVVFGQGMKGWETTVRVPRSSEDPTKTTVSIETFVMKKAWDVQHYEQVMLLLAGALAEYEKRYGAEGQEDHQVHFIETVLHDKFAAEEYGSGDDIYLNRHALAAWCLAEMLPHVPFETEA